MEKYRNLGLKLTPQRLAILRYLDGNTSHPSAEDIYSAMLRKYPTMSFATVYNTLEALRRIGEISELTIDPGKKRFDPDTSPHHHLICTQCRAIRDIHIDFRVSLPEKERNRFEITGNHVEFYGICPECRKGGQT